eukprot:2086694-Prymnesium_polylepis.1
MFRGPRAHGPRGAPRGSATYPDLRWVRAPPGPRTLSDFRSSQVHVYRSRPYGLVCYIGTM